MAEHLFLYKKDTPSTGAHYEAYTSKKYNGQDYLFRRITVSGDVTTTEYWTGSGALAADWTARAAKTYLPAPDQFKTRLLIT